VMVEEDRGEIEVGDGVRLHIAGKNDERKEKNNANIRTRGTFIHIHGQWT